jgi:hypothetical protein
MLLLSVPVVCAGHFTMWRATFIFVVVFATMSVSAQNCRPSWWNNDTFRTT